MLRIFVPAAVISLGLLALAAPAKGVTVGANLNQAPAFSAGCEVASISPTLPAPPSCSMFDPLTGQTPPGRWQVTSAQVRTGPRTGPMRFTMIQALRSKSGAGGVICCTASSQGPVFTPQPNSVTTVPLDMLAVNTVELVDREQIEVVDYLGISLLNQAGSIAFAPSQFPATTYFAPAFNNVGQTILAGSVPFSVAPMISAELDVCRTNAGASVSASGCLSPRFSLANRVGLSKRGTRATITARVPAAGALRIRQAGKGKSLVRKASTRVRQAGKKKLSVRLTGRGVRALKRRGRVKVSLRVTFKPSNGKASSKKIKVNFRR